ncbi:PSD1 and planctomycete cytochrome C domain-containing protein [bacterium]|nr:PSD1 and planctomycete cytochrome C domain-containing protein [bacterium]
MAPIDRIQEIEVVREQGWTTLAIAALSLFVTASARADLDFNRDIRPLLSNHCFKCHGPDEETRKAGLRLDTFESATAPLESGNKSIVPHHPDQSGLIERILSDDAELMMPPPSANKPLSAEDKEKLKQWITEGARYSPHWAFVPPAESASPGVKDPTKLESPIDGFIVARLDREGLSPSPRAEKHLIARRLYLDLIGLPPSIDEAEDFLAEGRPDSEERLVDRLLASPHYGERWARRWLDLARYADTNGYEKDRVRSIWPYRDWVIQAFNSDMPFDQFSIEQLAGDLVPKAGLNERIATGFHRNTMLNEEGGVDPNEFRFYAMVDRVNTTGTIWMGLTIGCAQCHTHKYDPVTQRDYYKLMAFLNNADEPEMPVPQKEIAKRQAEVDEQIARAEANIQRFPFDSTQLEWSTVYPAWAASREGATFEPSLDGSLRINGKNPEKDLYTIEFDSDLSDVVAIRVEALSDPALPNGGPGRVGHGNFVLSEVSLSLAQLNNSAEVERIEFSHAESDYDQPSFPAWQAIDGNMGTGWAVHRPGAKTVGDHTLVLQFARPMNVGPGRRWVLHLDQSHGQQHTIGRFRISLGRFSDSTIPLDDRRKEQLQGELANWINQESPYATHWKHLRPIEAKSNLPYLTILDDDSVLSSGDQTKSDTYDLRFQTNQRRVTAIRLEAIPDERLPRGGPGRIYYEGPIGDFMLSEFSAKADGQPIKIRRALASYVGGGNVPERMIDGDKQSGWAIDGGQGRPHVAVFELDEPIDISETFDVSMLFERYYAAGLGRFRISLTTDGREARDTLLPANVEDVLAVRDRSLNPEEMKSLRDYFLSFTPKTEAARKRVELLRSQRPEFPTTLVMTERLPGYPRITHLHKRGEFLQPADPINAELPSMFEKKGEPRPANRLEFAKWLVSPDHPLTARVTVNRHWAAFFGTGIVRTTEDFGYQGELPSHPDLIDWLSVEFVRRGWSLKELHRMIVTSATYLQETRVTPELLERDAPNRLLARGPRIRLEAEVVRDSILFTSGLLTAKVGGPSVFPPQPAGITSEGTYGPLQWKVSEGADRYRRALYTFTKRTAPFAMFTTFDAPSGEACVARREVSNTPLQALTLLNDTLTDEAARMLGIEWAVMPGSVEEKIERLVKRCLVRSPGTEEKQMLLSFYDKEKYRIVRGEVDPKKIMGSGEGDLVERASWTLLARALFNLDETIVKE